MLLCLFLRLYNVKLFFCKLYILSVILLLLPPCPVQMDHWQVDLARLGGLPAMAYFSTSQNSKVILTSRHHMQAPELATVTSHILWMCLLRENPAVCDPPPWEVMCLIAMPLMWAWSDRRHSAAHPVHTNVVCALDGMNLPHTLPPEWVGPLTRLDHM